MAIVINKPELGFGETGMLLTQAEYSVVIRRGLYLHTLHTALVVPRTTENG